MRENQETSLKPFHYFADNCKKEIYRKTKEPELSLKSLTLLNKYMRGLPKNRLTVIGARTSQGKTDIIVQMLVDLLSQGKTIMYLGFEMKQEELMTRMLCNKCQIDNLELSIGEFSKYQEKIDYFFNEYIKNIRLIATDHFAKEQKDLIEFLDTLKEVPDVIIVDYIQAISQGLGKGKDFIDKYILSFRNLCIERNFSGVIVSQLNRSSQERKDTTPQLHDLKGSGYLEEISDLCLLLSWVGQHKKGEEKSEYIVNVAKNRSGRTGFVPLKYYPQYSMFTDKDADLEQATKEILQNDWEED